MNVMGCVIKLPMVYLLQFIHMRYIGHSTTSAPLVSRFLTQIQPTTDMFGHQVGV